MGGSLKIAIWYNLPSGGAKRSLRYHVEGLVQRGHHIEMWRPPMDEADYLPLDGLATEHVIPQDDFNQMAGSRIGRLLGHASRTGRMISALDDHAKRCAEQIAKGGFDVLYSNIDMWLHSPFIGRYLNIPKSLYLHEPKRPLYEAMPQLPWILPEGGPKAKALDRINLNAARTVITEELKNAQAFDQRLVNSLYSRESVLRAYGLNSELCYLGVDTRVFLPLNLPREPYVMGLGTMGPSKNARLVIEALGQIPSIDRPKLVWVANLVDGPYLDEMNALARKLGVEFDFRKMVSDEELVQLLNQAKAMVYAPRLEPFGFAPLEANACGTPVVAVAEGGVRETVIDGANGLLVEHDPAQMAKAIQRLITDQALWERLSENALIGVRERWSLEPAIDRVEARLFEVIARRHGTVGA